MTTQEIAYLRRIATAKCLSDSNSAAIDFIDTSNERMADYDRNSAEWDYTFKKGTSTVDTHKIYVWKVTSDTVYFRIRVASTPPKNIFVKFTKTMNNDLIRNLQDHFCDQTNFKGSSFSSGSISLRNDDKTFFREDASTKYKEFRTFSFVSSQPGFFGHLKEKIDKKLYDNDEKLKSTTTTTYDVKSDTTPTSQDETDYTDDTSYPNRFYCMINSDNPDAGETYRKYTLPINFLVTDITATATSNLSCATGSDTPTITVGGLTFTPATELKSPF